MTIDSNRLFKTFIETEFLWGKLFCFDWNFFYIFLSFFFSNRKMGSGRSARLPPTPTHASSIHRIIEASTGFSTDSTTAADTTSTTTAINSSSIKQSQSAFDGITDQERQYILSVLQRNNDLQQRDATRLMWVMKKIHFKCMKCIEFSFIFHFEIEILLLLFACATKFEWKTKLRMLWFFCCFQKSVLNVYPHSQLDRSSKHYNSGMVFFNSSNATVCQLVLKQTKNFNESSRICVIHCIEIHLLFLYVHLSHWLLMRQTLCIHVMFMCLVGYAFVEFKKYRLSCVSRQYTWNGQK